MNEPCEECFNALDTSDLIVSLFFSDNLEEIKKFTNNGTTVTYTIISSTFNPLIADLAPDNRYFYPEKGSWTFAEGINYALRNSRGKDPFILFTSDNKKVIVGSDIGLDEYLKSPYWVLEDYRLREKLLYQLEGDDFTQDNPLPKPDMNRIDEKLFKNAFHILWNIPLEVDDYEKFILDHFTWSEDMRR